MNNRINRQKPSLLTLFLPLSGALVAAIITGCSKDNTTEQEAPEPPRLVRIVKARVQERHESYRISGRVVHAEEAFLSFRAGGFVEHIRVDAGDHFRKGDTLATLDATEIAAGLHDAVAQREQLERDVQRLRTLKEQAVATQKQLEDAETGLERARAAEQRARFTLEKAAIIAPYNGLVAARIANEGEMLGQGKPVLRVVDTSAKRRIRMGVPSRLTSWIRKGQSAEVKLETVPQILEGTIVEVGGIADPRTGNVTIEVELPKLEGIFEGVIAKVTLLGPSRDIIPLPGGALAEADEDRAFVFVVEDNVALRREVRIEEFHGDTVFVAPTLPSGTILVGESAGFLRDGEPVRVDGEIRQ